MSAGSTTRGAVGSARVTPFSPKPAMPNVAPACQPARGAGVPTPSKLIHGPNTLVAPGALWTKLDKDLSVTWPVFWSAVNKAR